MKKFLAVLISGLFATVALAQDAPAKPGIAKGADAVARTEKMQAGTDKDPKVAEELKAAKKAKSEKRKANVAKGKQATAETKKLQAGTELDAKNAAEKKAAKKAKSKKRKAKVAKGKQATAETKKLQAGKDPAPYVKPAEAKPSAPAASK